MTQIIKHIIFWTFLIPCSCQSQDNIEYALIKDIQTDFKIQYLTDSAYQLIFRDNSARDEFIKACKKFIPKKELTKLLDKNSITFQWEKNKLNYITIISADSLLKINSVTKLQNYLYHISSPIFDSKREYAIIRIFQQLPDESMAYGGECIYLFHLSNAKWTEVTRENCSNY